MVAWSALIGLYGLLQLFALGFLRSTLSGRTLLRAVLVGLYTCTVVAYPLEFLAVHGLALAGVANPAMVASYTIDPVIEELVKAAPLVLVALRAGATLGITDLLLLGAATGLGFRFAEEWLRLTRGIDPGLPSLSALLGWLPSGQQTSISIDWGGQQFPLAIAGALVWTAMVGLGLGLARWMPGAPVVRIIAPILALAWVSLDHALVNFSVTHAVGTVVPATAYPGPTGLLFLLDGFGRAMPYYLLAGVILAVWLDSRRVGRLLGIEGVSLLGDLRLLVAALRKPRGHLDALRRFQRLRCQLAYGRGNGPGALHRAVATARRQLQSSSAASARSAVSSPRAFEMLPYAALWVGFVVVFVAGTTPATSQPWRIQQILANPATPALFLIGAVLAARNLRRFARAAMPEGPDADVRIRHQLGGLISLGITGAIGLGLWAGLSKGALGFFLHGGAHLYDAAQGTAPLTIVVGTAPGASTGRSLS